MLSRGEHDDDEVAADQQGDGWDRAHHGGDGNADDVVVGVAGGVQAVTDDAHDRELDQCGSGVIGGLGGA
ncbi:hypothetical protein E1262_24980 [Jiangella aurantiaca]|uniref:Uncharacterized protein n=1 Tax=Jiangella aurantiaca TaxID=2530373 RepID=A0A4R5A4F8_9ACTN|nr:hypothetical protein [Jiangella aurantiaca]TDD65564.1 hypothetical protein E1262_24980 [Jiangella aurantiaca]